MMIIGQNIFESDQYSKYERDLSDDAELESPGTSNVKAYSKDY
jgi:hypothetical protein